MLWGEGFIRRQGNLQPMVFIHYICFNSGPLIVVTDQSATEADGEILEGILNRKHEWESTTKKASNR